MVVEEEEGVGDWLRRLCVVGLNYSPLFLDPISFHLDDAVKSKPQLGINEVYLNWK